MWTCSIFIQLYAGKCIYCLAYPGICGAWAAVPSKPASMQAVTSGLVLYQWLLQHISMITCMIKLDSMCRQIERQVLQSATVGFWSGRVCSLITTPFGNKESLSGCFRFEVGTPRASGVVVMDCSWHDSFSLADTAGIFVQSPIVVIVILT